MTDQPRSQAGQPPGARTTPTGVKAPHGAKELEISWADGHRSRFPHEILRGYCPCAGCQGHSGVIQFQEGGNLELRELEQVGNYALGLGWGDSHNTGIYSFRYLRDAYPATISSQFSGATSFQAAGSLRTGLPNVVGPDLSQTVYTLPVAVGTTTFPQVFNRGYIESYNFTIERDAGAGFNVQAAYVGSRAIRQTVIEQKK